MAPLSYVDVEAFGGKWRENDVKTSKRQNRHTDVMHESHIRRHFLALVGLTEIPVGYARMISKLPDDLLQCSSGVVRHPRDLQVSLATRFCRVLIFASSLYLSVIYLFHVMIHWWVRKPPRGPNKCMFWTIIEAKGEVGRPWNRFKPPQYFYTDRSKAVLLLWFLTVLAVCVYTLIQLLC